MQCPMLVMMMDDQSLLVQWQILTPLLLASKNSLVYTSLSPFSVFNFHLFLPSYSLVIRTQYYKVYQSMAFLTILRAKRATLRDLIARYLAHVTYHNSYNLLLFYREIEIWVELMC